MTTAHGYGEWDGIGRSLEGASLSLSLRGGGKTRGGGILWVAASGEKIARLSGGQNV